MLKKKKRRLMMFSCGDASAMMRNRPLLVYAMIDVFPSRNLYVYAQNAESP